ncbi:unnamed protein product, partial [Discosporangium mesarthrocarpum]
GTYVITGGTGGIGLAFAERLGRAGAGGIVLLSRRGTESLEGIQPGTARYCAWGGLSRTSAKVLILRCDVCSATEVLQAFKSAHDSPEGLPPIRGVIHAACPPQGGGHIE